jgi:hypothetical protein
LLISVTDDPQPPVSALAGNGAEIAVHRAPAARDEVLVVALRGGGGLITYRRPDGGLLHTLNTPEGFARKLSQLGAAPYRLASETRVSRPAVSMG